MCLPLSDRIRTENISKIHSPHVYWIAQSGNGFSWCALDSPIGHWIALLDIRLPCVLDSQWVLESLIGHWIALLYIGLHCVLESPTVY